MIRRRVIVSGEVQGVGFRENCRRRAATHPVAGWVRNRPDGRVEAAFEGEPAAVEAMVDWCRHGPRWAEVTGIEVSDEPPEGETGFRVR